MCRCLQVLGISNVYREAPPNHVVPCGRPEVPRAQGHMEAAGVQDELGPPGPP